MRSYFEQLDAELGVYAMQYHSRLPLASLSKGNIGQTGGAPTGPTFGPASTSGYVIDYPEDQQVFGASFATNVGGWAWSGEVSMAKDAPIQINANDLLAAGLTNGAPGSAPAALTQRVSSAPNNTIVNGFDPEAMAEFFRVLAPGGVLLFAESTRKYIEAGDIRALMTTEDAREATRAVVEVARSCCAGKVVSSLEGGYDLEGLGRSAVAHVQALGEE